MDRFWEILDERLELCHRALRCRHERLLGTVSDVAPVLWQYGALARLKTDPSFKDSLAYLKKHLNYRDSTYPFYFEYYMSQALFHADQEVWKEWNYKNMRYLGASQAPNGSWLSDHSAAYSTSAALLSLALNYRFLPIYEQ